jgi:hypothetical protein
MKKDNIDLAIMHCYRELYANAQPPARFDDLPIFDKESRFFMDYVLSEEQQNKIIEKTMDDFKIDKHKRRAFKTTIILGCSPKYM